MKFNLYIFSLLLLSISACTSKSFQHRDLSLQSYRIASMELENEKVSACEQDPMMLLPENSREAKSIPTAPRVGPGVTKDKFVRYGKVSKSKEAISIPKEITPGNNIDDPLDETPPKFNRDNIFWKIGRTLIRIGGGSFAVFGSLFISLAINSGSGYFFLSGILVSLAFILLSIPFFLLGIIAEIMKMNAKPTLESPNEI